MVAISVARMVLPGGHLHSDAHQSHRARSAAENYRLGGWVWIPDVVNIPRAAPDKSITWVLRPSSRRSWASG